MFTRLLVPLDGSPLAEIALPYAEQLCRRESSEVVLEYVSEDGTESDMNVHLAYLKSMVTAVTSGLQSTPGEPGPGSRISVRPAVSSGHPAEKIVDDAEKEDVDLIVMATHGHSGIRRWSLGSIADKVIKATRKPILLIRAKNQRNVTDRTGLFSKVLVPLDGSKESEAVLPYMEEISLRFNSEITLFQALSRGYQIGLGFYTALTDEQAENDKKTAQGYLEGVASRLKMKGVNVLVSENFGSDTAFVNAAESIIQLSSERHDDLIAMATHGRSGVGRWVMGSVAQRVLDEGNVPLLLVRVPK